MTAIQPSRPRPRFLATEIIPSAEPRPRHYSGPETDEFRLFQCGLPDSADATTPSAADGITRWHQDICAQ
jgi:hypothetical protein